MKTASEWEKVIWETKMFGDELIRAIQADVFREAAGLIDQRFTVWQQKELLISKAERLEADRLDERKG